MAKYKLKNQSQTDILATICTEARFDHYSGDCRQLVNALLSKWGLT